MSKTCKHSINKCFFIGQWLLFLWWLQSHQLSWRSFHEIEFRSFLNMLNKMMRLPEMPTFNYWVVYCSISFFFISKSPWLWFRWSHLLKIAAPCNFRPFHFAFSITSVAVTWQGTGRLRRNYMSWLNSAASFVTNRCVDISCIKSEYFWKKPQLKSTPLIFWNVAIFRKDFAFSEKPLIFSILCGIFYRW